MRQVRGLRRRRKLGIAILGIHPRGILLREPPDTTEFLKRTSAERNSFADRYRSSGFFFKAWPKMASSGSGNPGSIARGGLGSHSTCARISSNGEFPLTGFVPVASSYNTAPKE
jgi:hypothetical protein